MGIPINSGYYVGHLNLRISVMGLEKREAKESEIEGMKRLLEDSMKSGAFGLSVALNHIPARFASTKEIIELCKVVAKYGGSYAQHRRYRGFVEDAEEGIKIAEKSGARTILSHQTAGDIGWPQELDKHEKITNMIIEAREKSLDVIRDMVVYGFGSPGPSSALPHWVVKDGDDKAVERLLDPDLRKKIKEDIRSRNPIIYYNLDDHLVCISDKTKDLEGKTWSEISEMRGQEDVLDAVLDILAENGLHVKIARPRRSEEGTIHYLKDPLTIPESDSGSSLPISGLEKLGDARAYGTFPLLLGRYIRELGIIPLEEAIRKITSFPAQRMEIQDRGLLREGMWADIVIFDPQTVAAKATPLYPNKYPEGIKYVIVNGAIAVDDGKYTDIFAGKVLKH